MTPDEIRFWETSVIDTSALPLEKICHKAKLIGPNGQVSALCFRRPKAIDLTKEVWTIVAKAVTCPECIAALQKARKA